ncbi:hypothetical protein M0813_17137 [Anaeramoeba flamelloides]|uniref:Uncharacterized protein n=1 Tax=Anaeramoeba flamelloides TaxID=1746091 RepID=A0AAV7ZV07_9EUKA|nr:hypothetical protein M0812_10813 [Anaeramoeba flamelloides]KAJ6249342.1 hypothetical protein M0813_17137 [Anaeramoeba flamelloides]
MTEPISIIKQEESPKKKSISWNESNLKEIEELHVQIFKSPKKTEELCNKNEIELSEESDEEFYKKKHTKQFLEKRKKYKQRQKQIRTHPIFEFEVLEKDDEIKTDIQIIKK